jgi:hypothetical protein
VHEQVEQKSRRLANKSRGETFLVRGLRKEKNGRSEFFVGIREFPRIIGSSEIEGRLQCRSGRKVRSSGRAGASIGITRSVVLLVDRHIGSS